ncbi:MAG: exodeoxyribonuclease III [Gammaproteobacteria bacterium]|nr:exodeoxyribonuclease III [Gammaproteobacteria bacterium]MDH3380437.1 exodeoxyribonuclease III [Gammaproteobacteria bacterium]
MSRFKVASWNVNSLRVRLPHVLEWIESHQPDFLCLQETKLPDDQFPAAEIGAAGYHAVYAGQRTYNGVAILSKTEAGEVTTGFPNYPDDQKRVLAATFDALRVLNVYVPNGQSVDSDKYQYKLEWLDHLHNYVGTELRRHPQLILLGDFNIAPQERDVHDPAAWTGKVLFSEPERHAFQRLLDLGLHDTFREREPDAQAYSWWDYRAAAFRRNLGLRIDHVLCSAPLAARLAAAAIDVGPRKADRPSDHAPVVAEFGG